jgi:phosphoglycolate phosphatase
MLWVFFDIDGTLLLTDGAGRSALRTALETVYGTSGAVDGYHFHGKTDPQIITELMVAAGLELAGVRRQMPMMWPIYLEELRKELEIRRARKTIMLLPGVPELLSRLEGEGVSLGLLTGNIEAAAYLKLEAAGVTARFKVGGYGSDSEDRLEIARVAVERSRSLSGDGGERAVTYVVVGDTPEDVACARAVNAGAVAVATGRHGVAELEETGADAVFSDLRDTEAVVRSIAMLRDAASAPANARGNGGSR